MGTKEDAEMTKSSEEDLTRKTLRTQNTLKELI